ncbi:MAG TPA: hypothetical protein VFD43_10445 [Planctomycetota bacterium]|nr:hypothetical protein [Planctomycetota bacterium]
MEALDVFIIVFVFLVYMQMFALKSQLGTALKKLDELLARHPSR